MGDAAHLASQLVDTPEREKAGADTASRYEFQTFWGLALLFQHHGPTADYAIVFEFHDDIALFDHPSEPAQVRFYQVKSKATAGGWTLPKLIERKKTAAQSAVTIKPSFLDRMYDNVAKFDPNVLSVDFVSNQPCSFNAGKTEFRFKECANTDFAKIVASIQAAYPAATEAQVGLLGFRQTDLSLADAATHIKGKLHQFVCDNLGAVTFNLETVYKAIVDDCRRKSAFTGSYGDFAQIVRNKGVTRVDVQDWLDTIALEQRAPDWAAIAPVLTDCPFLETRRIGQQYDIIRSAVLNTGDTALHRVRTAVRKAIVAFDPAAPDTLCQLIDTAFEECRPVAEKYLTPYLPEKLKAIIAYELHTHD